MDVELRSQDLPDGSPVLEARNLTKRYTVHAGVLGQRVAGALTAVDDVDLKVLPGQTLGIVGESGSGKSTLARLLVGLEQPTAGRVLCNGVDLATRSARQLRALRRDVQIVLQDPDAALNPRMTVEQAVSEPLRIHARAQGGRRHRARVHELLEQVGLAPGSTVGRYPHQLSGGQRQRVAIARALALDPAVLVLDEPVSALDVSVRAQIVNLLQELQRDLDFAAVFIAHDLGIVRHLSDRVAVMYLGRVVEQGSATAIYAHPSHPYTQALLSAAPALGRQGGTDDADRIRMEGEIPSALHPPSGCHVRTRCWKAQPICAEEVPELRDRGQGHPAACHFAEVRPSSGDERG